MKTTYKARAVCEHDARLVAAFLTKKNGRGKPYFHKVQRVTASGCILTFTINSDDVNDTGVHLLALHIAREESLTDCHRLVGTVAEQSVFDSEVVNGNYDILDEYQYVATLTSLQLLESLV